MVGAGGISSSNQISNAPEFVALKSAAEKGLPPLRALLNDESRNSQFTVGWQDILYDGSRQKLDTQTQNLLVSLAQSMRVEEKIKAMFNGEKVNATENRAALHVALRSPSDSEFQVDGVNVVPEVQKVLKEIQTFADDIRSGRTKGATGKPFRDIVCVGIGGSYLGAQFVYEALRTEQTAAKAGEGRRLRFLANVDPVDFNYATEDLSPETTLVIVISKTFTTAETMRNARAMKKWLSDGLKHVTAEALGRHFCAVSTNVEATSTFGISSARVFPIWDWVGGRFSVTSAVGVLPLTLHYGWPIVEQFLNGCQYMDKQFQLLSGKENLPLLMALHSVWNNVFLKMPNVAIVPYSQALDRFTAHLQQLSMESIGKGVTMHGEPLTLPAGPVFFGASGTNAQHSFFQLLHQGREIPVEFIGFIENPNPLSVEGEDVSSEDELMANFFAQPDALALGRTATEVAASGVPQELVPHKTFQGNRPSSVVLIRKLDAYHLGLLLALYEHRTVAEGFIMGINPFDQFGVELGKVLAKNVREWLKEARRGKMPSSSDQFCPPTRHNLSRYIEGKVAPA